jgi:hypothetical protein
MNGNLMINNKINIIMVLVSLWCLSPWFWLVCGVYRRSFGWFVVFIATNLVGLWYLSPRFWLVCGVYRHGFGWFVVFIATVLVGLWYLSPRIWG